MSYAQRKELSGNRTMSIFFTVVVVGGLMYAIVTGLAYNVVKKSIQDLKTFNVEEQPPPPEPPPPPRQTEARSLTGDIQGLIQSDDYPPSALDNNEQGTVHVTLTIGPSGRVVGCSPSGGPSSLQQATCRLLTARARFSPAQDANGNPITSTYSRSITWRIAE